MKCGTDHSFVYSYMASKDYHVLNTADGKRLGLLHKLFMFRGSYLFTVSFCLCTFHTEETMRKNVGTW